MAQPEPFTSPEPTIFGVFSSSVKPTTIPEPKPSAEPEPSAFPEPEYSANPEPIPKWSEAKLEFGILWDFHVYFVAASYTIIPMTSLINVIYLVTQSKHGSRRYYATIGVMVLILSVFRGLYFYVDAYNTNGTFPIVLAYVIMNIAAPCFTSAFYLIFTAISHMTGPYLIKTNVFSKKYIIVVITLFFTFSITTDLITGLTVNFVILAVACELIFAIWASCFAIAFIYLYVKMDRLALKRHLTIKAIVPAQFKSKSSLFRQAPVVLGILRQTAFLSLLFMLFGIAHCYGAYCALLVLYSRFPDPWPWWAFATTLRVIETFMLLSILYIATVELRHKIFGKKPKKEGNKCRTQSFTISGTSLTISNQVS